MRKKDVYFMAAILVIFAAMLTIVIVYIAGMGAERIVPAWLEGAGTEGEIGEGTEHPGGTGGDRSEDSLSVPNGAAYLPDSGEIVLDRSWLGIASEDFTVSGEGYVYTVSFDMPGSAADFYSPIADGPAQSFSVDGAEGSVTVRGDQPLYVDAAFDEDYVRIVVMPLKEKYSRIVYLDPGHGGVDEGAVRARIREKDINLKVALMVAEELARLAPDIHVILSRETDVEFDRRERAAEASAMADIFVSVHCNSYGEMNVDNDVTGTEVHYNPDQQYAPDRRLPLNSKDMAEIFLRTVTEAAGSRERGIVERGDLAITNNSTIPCVIIEMGYMSSAAEREQLNSEEYQRLLSNGVCDGILEILGS